MAKTYGKGASGAPVKKIQDLLGRAGYDGGNDSVYGDNTVTAVKQFQTDYGLPSNGVIDQKTIDTVFSAINGTAQKVNQPQQPQQNAQGSLPATEVKQPEPQKYDPRFGVTEDTNAKLQQLGAGYQPSQAVQDAQSRYQQTQAAKPGEYSSPYDGLIRDMYQKITSRGPFKYDVNGDALYEVYKDQYTLGGQQAMMDTMGQAAMLTGGYGNSYASTAGNQAYQQYMTQMANKVPELAQQAFDRYQAEGDELYRQYGMALDAEQQDYDRYNDQYNQWLTERDMARDDYLTEQQQDYDQYLNDRNYWQDQAAQEQANYWNQADMDAAAGKRDYETAMGMIGSGLMPSDDLLASAGISKADAEAIIGQMQAQALAAAAGKGGSGGGRGGKNVTEEMLNRAMDGYSKGGMENVAALMDMWEYQGYDVEYIYQYLQNYGSLKNQSKPAQLATASIKGNKLIK